MVIFARVLLLILMMEIVYSIQCYKTITANEEEIVDCQVKCRVDGIINMSGLVTNDSYLVQDCATENDCYWNKCVESEGKLACRKCCEEDLCNGKLESLQLTFDKHFSLRSDIGPKDGEPINEDEENESVTEYLPQDTESKLETTNPITEPETKSPITESKSTTPVTESETTNQVTESESTTPVTESETTNQVAESETTNQVAESESTTPVTESETTNQVAESESTTPVTESETTNQATESESTTPVTKPERTALVSESYAKTTTTEQIIITEKKTPRKSLSPNPITMKSSSKVQEDNHASNWSQNLFLIVLFYIPMMLY